LGRRAEACQEKKFQITGGFGSSYYDKENFGIFLKKKSRFSIFGNSGTHSTNIIFANLIF